MFINEVAAYFLLVNHSDDNFDQEGLPVEEAHAHAQTFIDAMLELFPLIEEGMDSEELMTHFYTIGKKYYGKPNLRAFFRDCYLMLTGRPEGSRIGVMVEIFGVDEFKMRMTRRLSDPLGEIR